MMTVHVLHAGDGYTYLTRQVANGDQHRADGQSLADYYAHEGNPPGRWAGAGMAGVGVTGAVDEQQMKNLFGVGAHPDDERIQLGRRFPRISETGAETRAWAAAIEQAYATFNERNGRPPEVGVERDLVRWNVAGEQLRERLGREPGDVERKRYLARVGARPRQPVAGYDLVFTPVKSVSTLWALGDERVRHEVAGAHEAAWRAAFAWVEQEAALTRSGAGGVAQVRAAGLLAAAFDHADSRAGEPNLHTHVAVANKVQGPDGKWRALDARVLHALGVAASERYNTAIEDELRTRLGVSFVEEERGRGRRPVREVEGIDAGVRGAFSSRRVAIESVYAELAADYRASHGHEPPRAVQFELAQRATLQTREGKEDGVSLSERRSQWHAAAASVLGSEHAVQDMLGRAVPAAAADAPADGGEVDVEELAAVVVAEVGSRRATWGPWHLAAEAQRQVRGRAPAGRAQEVAEEVAARARALSVPLGPGEELNPAPVSLQRPDGRSVYTVHGDEVLSSAAVLDAEASLLQAALTEAGPRVDEAAVAAAIAAAGERGGHPLNRGQVDLARAFASSGRLLVAGIGPAGTGKTSAMAAFVEAVQTGGGRVVALAPSAAAAAVLGQEVGTSADTLHKLLHAHTQAGTAGVPIPAGLELDASTVVLVDEAGMAGTPQLAQLLDLAREHGAAVRLLGDPQQLAAVEAGGVLRLIQERVGATELTEVHRFVEEAEADASLQLRDGESDAAEFYLDRGRVKAGTREAMVEEIYAGWLADTEAGKAAVMVAASNADVTVLSAQARRDLVEGGRVEADGIVLGDGTTAGRGDQIVTRRNERTLATGSGRDFVKNGDVWTVLDRSTEGALRVKHSQHGNELTLPAEYAAAHVQLAYAATVHRVQGMTVDTSHSLLDAGSSDRQALYTAATRGRQGNRLYLVAERDPGTGETHDPAPAADDAETGLRRIIARDGAARSATGTQEDAWRQATSLARLVPELEDATRQRRAETDGPGWTVDLGQVHGHPSSIEPDAREWATRQAGLIAGRVDFLIHEAAEGRARWSPAVPTVPEVEDLDGRGRWLGLAAPIASYRDRWDVRGADPLGAIAGGRQGQERAAAAAALEQLHQIPARTPEPAATLAPQRTAAERLRDHVDQRRQSPTGPAPADDNLTDAARLLRDRQDRRRRTDRPEEIPRPDDPSHRGPRI